MSVDIREYIRTIPDFPRKGILFRDITPLLKNPAAFKETVNQLHNLYVNDRIGKVAAIESRGFIIGAALAYKLNAGFVPIRKRGKLPGKTLLREYELEYGKDAIEIHADAIQPRERVVLVDDLLATGGTAKAAAQLIEDAGGIVHSIAFLIELPDLKGRDKLKNYDVKSLISFKGGL